MGQSGRSRDELEARRVTTSDEVRWFGEFELEAKAASAAELAGAIGDFLRDRHGLARQGLDRTMSVNPQAGRMHSVVLEPPTISWAALTARIPAGSAGRRDALTGIGWAIEKSSTGTRYYTRRFGDADRAPEEAARAIVDAGELLYGDRAKGVRWSIRVDPMRPKTAVTVQRIPGVAQEWRVQLDGTGHQIVLGKGPRAFLVDGVQHSLGGVIHRGPRIAAFDLSGHAASVTATHLSPTVGANLRHRFKKDRTLGLPRTILVSIVAGGAAGSGAPAASGVAALVWGWVIYELLVDGHHRGSWVRCLGGEKAWAGWVFVRPGEALPQRDWIGWPALPAPSPREVAGNRRIGMLMKTTLMLILVAFVLGVLFLPGGLLHSAAA